MNTRKTSKGFTLVELLIVIAIIGVLASLIMPNLGSVMGKGDQVKAQNAARSISNAWIAAARTGTKSRMIAAKDIYGWAEKLARYGDMNEPTMWILDFDVAVAEKAAEVKAYVVKGEDLAEVTFKLGDMTDAEREIITKGCLINYYRG